MHNEGIDEYEKVIDTLIFFGEGVTLDFCVELGRKDLNNERRYYYNEYGYTTSKYETNQHVVSVKRVISCYLQLSQKKSPIQLRIKRGMQDALQQVMEKADKWFSPNSKVFQYKDGRLVVIGDHTITLPFPEGFGIGFSPVVIFKNNLYEKGCRMYLNDVMNFVDITIERFKDFLNVIQRLEMYQAALGVLNQVRLTRAEMLEHRTEIAHEQTAFGNNSKANGRKKSSNFFEK